MSRDRGVTVHSSECPVALEADPQRRVACVWNGRPGGLRPIRVEVVGVDQPGLLAAVSKAIAQVGVNIRSAQATGIDDGKARNVFEVMVSDAQDLKKVMKNLGKVRGVMSVDRVRE